MAPHPFEIVTKRGTTHWYVLGRYKVSVSAIADEAVWNLEKYRDIRTKLEETLASFEPSTYTSDEYAYSVALPSDWKREDCTEYDYCAYNPTGPGQVYVQIVSAAGWMSIQAYGNAHTVRDSTILGREVVYTGRPNPGYRMDYTRVDETTGKTVRGAVLITLGGGTAVWVFVDDYQEDWEELSHLADDIFLRVAVIP